MKTSLPQVARIVESADESPKVRTLVLDLHLDAEPGQFVMAWLPDLNERPFSLVRAKPLTVTIARVGPFSTAVCALDLGARLWVRGPLGRPFTLPTVEGSGAGLPLLFIGGGYGVAPLHFLAERARASGWVVHMVIGARTAEDLIFARRFEELGARVAIATEDGSLGELGVATDAAERLLDQVACEAIYACGPEPMLEAVAQLARSRGLPAQLSYEGVMRCGFGVCGSCVREGWLACSDGPVRHVSA